MRLALKPEDFGPHVLYLYCAQCVSVLGADAGSLDERDLPADLASLSSSSSSSDEEDQQLQAAGRQFGMDPSASNNPSIASSSSLQGNIGASQDPKKQQQSGKVTVAGIQMGQDEPAMLSAASTSNRNGSNGNGVDGASSSSSSNGMPLSQRQKRQQQRITEMVAGIGMSKASADRIRVSRGMQRALGSMMVLTPVGAPRHYTMG